MKLGKLVPFFVLFLVVMSSAIVFAQQPPPPDYYPLEVGAWWQYQSTTSNGNKSEFKITVLNEEKQPDSNPWKKTEIQSGIAINEWYSKPSGWVLWHREFYSSKGQKVDFQPVRKFLKNPLSQGDTWQWEGKGIMDVDIKESSQVVGVEEVVVPAGKFATMKVVVEGTQGGGKFKKTMWFANHIGMVKGVTEMNSFQSTSELVDYSFKHK
ncbi:MAG: hypothetical protein ACRCT1_09420 [Microcoleaceae cyanobacterium]